MADKSLDQQTRRIDQARVQKGKEFEMLQQAQNQFLAIQAERKQNLAQQRTIIGMDHQQNAMMMQGAQMIAGSGSRDMGIPQTVDPRTQAVMSKYGMGRPRFQKSTQHSQQVTRQNVVIHNTTNNNTTNNVQAGNPAGPVAGRGLFVRGMNNDSTEKFKVWLNNSYARQQQQANIRNREYEKREDSLVRSGNKMMRKLEGIGKTIGKVLDPKRIGQTLLDPLKMLFMFMGFHSFIKNWKTLMNFLRGAESWMTGFADKLGFSWKNGKVSLDKERFANTVDGKLGFFGKQLVLAFGGNPYRGDNIGTILHNLIIGDKQHYGLWEQIKTYLKDKFNERGDAIKNFPIPDIKKYIKDGKPDFIGAGKELIGYLGNILGIALTGSSAIKKINYDNAKESNINSYRHDDTDSLERYNGIHSGATEAEEAKKNRLELQEKLNWDILKKENTGANWEKKDTWAKTGDSAADFLGKEKLAELKANGLELVSDKIEVNRNENSVSAFHNNIHGWDVPITVKNSSGETFTMHFNLYGNATVDSSGNRLWVSTRDKFQNSYYTGNLLSTSKGIGSKLSDLDISDNNELTTKSGVYRQFNELSKLIKDAKGTGGKLDEQNFAFGMERIYKYVREAEKDGYVLIPHEALVNVLGLSGKEVVELTENGTLSLKHYYTVVRKITIPEVLKINRETYPALKGLYEYVNKHIYSTGTLGRITALKDYGSIGLKSTLGCYLADKSQGKITKKAQEQLKKKATKKGLSEAVIKRAEKMAAKRIATRFAAHSILKCVPYVGWAFIAWDAIDLFRTFCSRSPEISAYTTWSDAETDLKNAMSKVKYIGDILDEDEYNLFEEADELDEVGGKQNLFDVKFIDPETGNLTTQDRARISLYSIKSEYLKKILDDKTKINDDIRGLDETLTTSEFNKTGELDFARAITEYGQHLSGNADYSISKGSTPGWISDISAENAAITKKEIRNEAIRNQRAEWDKKNREGVREQAKKDAQAAEVLGVTGMLKGHTNATLTDRIAYLKDQLYSAGITNKDDQNAIIANLIAESGLKPEKGEKRLNGQTGGGEGIAQWTDETRKQKILEYINKTRRELGKDPIDRITDATFEEQVSALLYNDHDGLAKGKKGHHIIEKMMKQSDLREKVATFMDGFENPVYSSDDAKAAPDSEIIRWFDKVDEKGNKYYNTITGEVMKEKRSYHSRNTEIDGRYDNLKNTIPVDGGEANRIAQLLADGAGYTVDGVNYLIDGIRYIKKDGTFKRITGAIGDVVGAGTDKAKELVNKVHEKPVYKRMKLDDMGPEFRSYEAYLENPGKLTPGLRPSAWQDEVYKFTGHYPNELTYITDRLRLEAPASSFKKVSKNDNYNNKGMDNVIAWKRALDAEREEEARKLQEEENAKKEREKQNNSYLRGIAENSKMSSEANLKILEGITVLNKNLG